MTGIELAAFALMTGLTVAGITGSLMELATGRTLGFREPFLTGRAVLRSLAAAALAGPLMLVNDALAARRAGRISVQGLLSCAATALVWATASGIVVISLASRITALAA
jgi:hypothetical protein